jgi:hypothetical protein
MSIKTYIETDQEYLNRVNCIKLESIHSALQELQQEFDIPNDHEHLEIAFKFTEDLREKYLEVQR